MKIFNTLLILIAAGIYNVGWANGRINNDDCLALREQAGIQACIDLAAAIGRDLHRLNANALVLEELGRHESAAQLYTAATAYFPRNKRALQGLVRSRANARAARFVTDVTPTAKETTECWTKRWMDALSSCQHEVSLHPDDARLHERLGDVARSVGDVSAAMSAYAHSLKLHPDNANLARKRRALANLLAGQPGPPDAELAVAQSSEGNRAKPASSEQTHAANRRRETPAPQFGARTSPTSHPRTTAIQPPPDPDQPRPPSDAPAAPKHASTTEQRDTVRQLELLEALRARNLINPNEYAERRSSLLLAAFGSPPQQRTKNRYRGLLEGRYLALVIGNNQYQAFPRLQTAAEDARVLVRMLTDRYGFEVTTLIDADRYQILTALSELRRQATPADSILLYYAGHGLLDDSAGRGFWLPTDAERDNFAQWISTDDIAGVFAGAEAKHALVIADSCFAGTLLRSAGATGLHTLERLAAKRSRTVLTSGGLEPVIDDGDGRHSVFAAALLDALSTNDSVLEASKLFAQVRERVVLNADQTPQYAPMAAAGHDGGDFLFIPKTLLTAGGTY